MSGIVEFLRARYTKAREREEGTRGVPRNLPFKWTHVIDRDAEYVQIEGHQRMSADAFYEQYGQPASDPTVLADLDAKLAILDEHPDAPGWDGHEVDGRVCRTCGEISQDGGLTGDPYPCRTLRHLALPFAAHPDYDEGWRP